MSFAKGTHARFICDRCGWEFPYSKRMIEKGTNLIVDKECYDGMYDLQRHPQNHPPSKLTDAIGLEDATSDRSENTGIHVYGQTSGGYATEFTSQLFVDVADDMTKFIRRDFPHSANISGINVSCKSGSAVVALIVASTTVQSSVAVNTSSGNTALSGTISKGDDVSFEITTNASCKSFRIDLATIRT